MSDDENARILHQDSYLDQISPFKRNILGLCAIVFIFLLLASLIVTIFVWDIQKADRINILFASCIVVTGFTIFYVAIAFIIIYVKLEDDQKNKILGTWSSFMSSIGINGSKLLLFALTITVYCVCSSISEDVAILKAYIPNSRNFVRLLEAKYSIQSLLLLVGFFPSFPSNDDFIFFLKFTPKALEWVSKIIHVLSGLLYLLATLVLEIFIIMKLEHCNGVPNHLLNTFLIIFWIVIIIFLILQVPLRLSEKCRKIFILQFFSLLSELSILGMIVGIQAAETIYIEPKMTCNF